MFVAGGLLSKRTGFVGSQLYARRSIQAVKGFLWGCLLFIPLGLANATAGSPSPGMDWVTHGWMPLTLQDRFLIVRLLFGLPIAVVFARRDWEHAVGAHYMIDMLPTVMVYLEN